MIRRGLLERFCVWWWDDPADPMAEIAKLFAWPVPLETDNVEIWDGGGA